jgi:hypothetical protein
VKDLHLHVQVLRCAQDDMVVVRPPFVPYVATFRDPLRFRDQRQLTA